MAMSFIVPKICSMLRIVQIVASACYYYSLSRVFEAFAGTTTRARAFIIFLSRGRHKVQSDTINEKIFWSFNEK